LCADAVRYHSVYGVYGISVFAIRDTTVDELAQQAPLVRFDRLCLEDGVQRLASCPHQVMPNAYHDA
jgi:hypothetical protein